MGGEGRGWPWAGRREVRVGVWAAVQTGGVEGHVRRLGGTSLQVITMVIKELKN